MAELDIQPLQFDYLTMQDEWRNYLIGCGYPADTLDPALIAEMVKLHSLMFAEMVSQQWGMVWDDLEGEFRMDALAMSVMNPPDPFAVDGVWSQIFDVLAESVEDIERALASPEV
jgi:hypothetical protein